MRLLVVLLISCSTVLAQYCPPFWTHHNNRCYKHIDYPWKWIFIKARQICKSHGSDLVSINTAEEFEFLKVFAARNRTSGIEEQPWIGLERKRGNWVWADGSPLTLNNWVGNEPNNYLRIENCVKFIVDQSTEKGNLMFNGQYGGFSDVYCGRTSGRLICERPSTVQPFNKPRQRPEAVSTLNCGGDPEWVGLAETGSCYRLFNDMPSTHDEAEEHCKKYRGHLTSITSAAENNFLTNLAHIGHPSLYTEHPWIGYRRYGSKWQWTDGFVGNGGLQKAIGEPNNFLGIEACGQLIADKAHICDAFVMYFGKVGIMNDWWCQSKIPRFICKVQQKYILEFDPTPKKATPPKTTRAPVVKQLFEPCPWYSTREGDSCRCKSGYTDIRNTNFPEKADHEPGRYCISNNPCANVNQSISVLFVIDSSGSITAEDWKSLVHFVEEGAPLLPRRGRVGFIRYSSEVSAKTWLSNKWTNQEYLEKLPREQDGYKTNTPEALETANSMFSDDNSDRQVVILITDGVPQITGYTDEVAHEMTLDAARDLHMSNKKVLVVGIGEHLYFQRNQLLSWVTSSADYFNYAQDINQLTSTHMRNIMMRVCAALD